MSAIIKNKMERTSSRKRVKPNFFKDYIVDDYQIQMDDQIGWDEEEWEKNEDTSNYENEDDQVEEVCILFWFLRITINA